MPFIDDDLFGFGHPDLPGLGLRAISIADASVLIAEDMCAQEGGPKEAAEWLGVEISKKQVQEGEGPWRISSFLEQLLLSSVEDGSLVPDRERRTFLGELSAHATYVKWERISDWLQVRGYQPGEKIDQWLDLESKIEWALIRHGWRVRLIADEGGAEAVDRLASLHEGEDGAPTREELVETIAELKATLHSKKLYERFDRPIPEIESPLTSRERGTLLKLLIGMAVDGYGFDPAASKSPVPAQIAEALAGLGLPIDSDTVRKWLKEAAKDLPASKR